MKSEFYTGEVEEPVRPFSNGTEAMIWQGENCDRCVKAFHGNEKNRWPKESTLKEYVRMGKYCKLQYWLDIGWIEGSIPLEIAKQIGYDGHYLKQQCLMYSDKDDDGFHYPKKPKPDNTPPNQLVMPFLLQEIGIKELSRIELVNDESTVTQQSML